MDVPLHADVEPWGSRLLGTWRGEGAGHYPSIDAFRYSEEITFGHAGKPFLAYRQTTVNLDTGIPAHAEAGYWRHAGPGRVELVMAHPSGIVEVEEGTVEVTESGVRLHLRSTSVAMAATAKSVETLEREIEVSDDVFHYDLSMGAVGLPHQHHLSATLRRVDS